MNKLVLFILFFSVIFLFSCQNKKQQNIAEIKIDHVDLYPKYYNCDDFYEKEQQLDCLKEKFLDFLRNDIEINYQSDFQAVNDTVWVQFLIDTVGNTRFLKLYSNDLDSIQQNRLIEVFGKISKKIPLMKPAVYQDKPVEFRFKIPVIIQTDSTQLSYK